MGTIVGALMENVTLFILYYVDILSIEILMAIRVKGE